MTTEKSAAPGNVGAIETDKIYPLTHFKAVSGLKDWALRKAKRDGLKIRRCGRNSYVCGSDFAEFLTKENT